MKLTTFLLLICFTTFASTGYSQPEKVTVKLKDANLKQFFGLVEQQTYYKFLYRDDAVGNIVVNLDETDRPLDQVLNEILEGSGFSYKILANNLVVIASTELLQQQNVTGTVTDAKTREPLIGVTIVVEGTTQGALTDAKGQFSIQVPGPASKLVFSFIGYESQKIEVGTKAVIDVEMVSATIAIDEVVVIAYGTQKKINVTGSVATMEGKVAQKAAVSNISNALAGNLPGLVAVQRGGQPGNDKSDISIRGFENALVIVDGIEQAYENLDPNDIESISVLKDASAAIYGARGGNGVLLITTKRGALGKPRLTFEARYGTQQPTRPPKYADAALYAKMYNDAEIFSGRPARYSEAEIEKFKNGSDPNYPNTNWYNETYNASAPMAQYNLNSSGGNESVKYFASLGYMKQDGLLKSGDIKFSRYNFRTNIDAKITKSLSVTFDLSGRYEKPENPAIGTAEIVSGIQRSKPIYPSHLPDPTKLSFSGDAQTGASPIALSTADVSGYDNSENKVIIGSLGLKYEAPFLKGLSARGLFNYNTSTGSRTRFTKQITMYGYDPATQVYSQASTFGVNSLQKYSTNSADWTSQLFLNFNRKFGLHDIGAMFVAEYINSEGNNFNAYGQDLLTNTIPYFFVAAANSFKAASGAYSNGRVGYISRFNYSYNEKYLFEGSTRYDASSRFIPSKQWGFFPSVSLGWVASKENFLKDVSWVDNLKLRASYGTSGDDSQGYYDWLSGYMIGGGGRYDSYVFGATPVNELGIRDKGLPTDSYSWKRMATQNIGLDASFLKGLVSVTFDAFYREVTGEPGRKNLSIPYTFGASNLPLENLNSYDNRGFELVLGHKNSIGEFRYSLAGNISWTRSKWIHYDEAIFPDNATRERLQLSGQWKNRWFGYDALGIFQSQQEIDDWPVIQDNNGNRSLKPGDMKYADYNHDGVLNYLDNHVIGRGATPEIMFGLNITAAFKGFDLLMLWQGATNFNDYFANEAAEPGIPALTPLAILADYWTPTNPNAKYPNLVYNINNYYQSTYWLQDGTYLRLKNIQLGYTIPERLIKKLAISSLRLYVSAFNIFTIDKAYPYDPETGGDSYSNRGWYYPQQKTMNVGVNISF